MFFLQPSQKRLLSSLNPIFFIVAVFALLLLRTSWTPLLPNFMQQWDVLLPFVVFFGQRRSIPEGLILSLFTSHLYSLCSAAPIGVFTSHYLTLFVIARLLSYVIYANTWFSILLLMFALSLLSRVVLTVVATAFGHGWPVLSMETFSVWGLMFNGLMGYVIYGALGGMDRMTYKAPRISIELAGDSL